MSTRKDRGNVTKNNLYQKMNFVFTKTREFDWTRLVSTLIKSSLTYLGPKISTLFWCTGWGWNQQIIFRFANILGCACFILIRYLVIGKTEVMWQKTTYIRKWILCSQKHFSSSHRYKGLRQYFKWIAVFHFSLFTYNQISN
jgi:hypothetical protein